MSETISGELPHVEETQIIDASEQPQFGEIPPQMQGMVEAHLHMGPLPDPEVFARYNEVLPGAADRLLKLVEDESTHRRVIEERQVEIDARDSLLGIKCATGISICCVIGGLLIIFVVPGTASVVAGSIISLSGIASVVGAFLRGTEATWKKGNKTEE